MPGGRNSGAVYSMYPCKVGLQVIRYQHPSLITYPFPCFFVQGLTKSVGPKQILDFVTPWKNLKYCIYLTCLISNLI